MQSGVKHFACGPRLHEYFREIGGVLKEFDAFSVGEMPGVHDEREILKAVGQDRGELAMAFQLEIVDMQSMPISKWLPRKFEVRKLREIVQRWQRCMLDGGGWNALYMEIHVLGRSVSRYASDEPVLRTISAKMLAAHLALQSGTLFVYQGQELGMANVPRDWGLEKYKDIELRNHWEQEVMSQYPNDAEKQKMFKEQYRLIGRDNARTPMQWTASEQAGFMPQASNMRPWMDIHPDYQRWNAERIVTEKHSSFHYWRKLLELRKKEKDVFVYGDFEMLDLENQ